MKIVFVQVKDGVGSKGALSDRSLSTKETCHFVYGLKGGDGKKGALSHTAQVIST